MSALVIPTRVEGRKVAVSLRDARRIGTGALVGLAVAYTLVPFVDATGGRGPGALTRTAVVVLLALLAVRPWRVLRPSVLALAAIIAGAALVVCLVTQPGWLGANRAASYGLSAAVFVTVAAYARTRRRRVALATLIVVAGAIQFFHSFVPWWGGANPAAPMVGTFYWHNQFAAFLLAPAMLGVTLVLMNRAPWRFAGWVAAPFAVAGVVHSSSRGAELVLVIGWACLGALAMAMRTTTPNVVRRYVALSVLAAVVSFGVSGPPFFNGFHLPWQATQERAASGQSLAQNSGVRMYLWRESVAVIEHNPVTGVGYGALAPAAVKVTPASWPHSPLSHDDYLQPWVDGGLILGAPFLIACLGIVRVLFKRGLAIWTRPRRDWLGIGLLVATLAMMAHSAIDFDWSYPALFSTVAMLAALAVAPGVWRSTARTRGSGRALAGGFAIVVLVVAVAVGAVAGRHGGNGIVVAIPHTAPVAGAVGP